jgi:large subunit ribosomal protein L25
MLEYLCTELVNILNNIAISEQICILNPTMLKLKANKRPVLRSLGEEGDEKTSPDAVRSEGSIPGVVYGPKQKAVSFTVKAADFKKVYEEAGESTIISLDVEGEEHDTLIHDIQFDPVKGNPIHVDFYAVERGKKLQVSVALVFEGLAPAEKNLGAMVVKVAHEVEIESLPRDLPSELKVDLTKLEQFGDQVLAKDIELPEGVELITGEDEVIALAKETVEEVIEEAVEAPDMDDIEVEQKGKGESADAEGSGETKEGETPAEEKSE